MIVSAHLAMALAAACAIMFVLRLTIRLFRSPNAPRWTKVEAAATVAGLLLTALPAVSMAALIAVFIEAGFGVWTAFPGALAVHAVAYTVFTLLLPLAAPSPAGGTAKAT